MEQEFDQFEDKLAHFIKLFARLREENNELRQNLASKTDEVKRLNEKLEAAKTRIGALIEKLPEVDTKAEGDSA